MYYDFMFHFISSTQEPRPPSSSLRPQSKCESILVFRIDCTLPSASLSLWEWLQSATTLNHIKSQHGVDFLSS